MQTNSPSLYRSFDNGFNWRKSTPFLPKRPFLAFKTLTLAFYGFSTIRQDCSSSYRGRGLLPLVKTAWCHPLKRAKVKLNKLPNWSLTVNFASANRLVVYSTRFQHPQRHLVTWLSNDGRTRNQIDHMLVRSRWASSVIDCRA